jgi:hypothetical protein
MDCDRARFQRYTSSHEALKFAPSQLLKQGGAGVEIAHRVTVLNDRLDGVCVNTGGPQSPFGPGIPSV